MNELSPRTAKLFWSGRSQAIRLPKEFRFDGTQVRIRREEDGSVNIALLPDVEDDWIERLAGSMDEDWARAIEEGHLGPEHMPDSPRFD